jgi:hypothetical protein
MTPTKPMVAGAGPSFALLRFPFLCFAKSGFALAHYYHYAAALSSDFWRGDFALVEAM